jgi:hypothetical protein
MRRPRPEIGCCATNKISAPQNLKGEINKKANVHINVTLRAVPANHFCSGKAKIITYSVSL